MVSKLIVIRHGITEGNEKRWFYGKTDLPLLKRGRETLLEYKRAGVYPEIPDDAQCVVSGLARTRETMDLLYERSECVEIEKLATSPVSSVEKNWLLGSWNTLPTRLPTSQLLRPSTSLPLTRTRTSFFPW